MLVDLSYITPSSILAAAIVPTVLSIIVVVLRFWVRRKQKAPLLSDDWLLIPGLLLTIGMAIALIVGVAGHGMGYTKGLPPGSPPEAQLTYLAPNVVLTEQIEYAVQLMQIISLGFIKSSFIMFYRRVFCTAHRTWFWYATIVMLALIVAWTITFFFVFVFYCGSNHWAEWDTVINLETYCPNGLAYQAGLAISDFIMDIMVIVLPIPVVARLQIDLTKRILVLGVFLFGLVALAASTTRMAIFIIDVTVGFNLQEDGDKTIGLILFWSIIENGAAIVAACLPTLRFFVAGVKLESVINSIRSRFSLQSLRSSRNPTTVSSSGESQEAITPEKFHLARIQGESTVESSVGHSLEPQDSLEEGAISVRKDILQHEDYV